MHKFKRVPLTLFIGCATVALAGCGADDIASPGEGVIVLPSPTPTPGTSPTPTPGGSLATPASACPTLTGPDQLTNSNTITGPTGTYLVCTLPARFTTSTTLPKVPGVLYRMNGRVDVGTDAGPGSTGYTAVLSIDPGVVIYAEGGPTFMAVNRGNQINAVGTPTAPIIFTSRANVVGTNDDTSQGQWGGVVLLGRAPVTDCFEPGTAGVAGNQGNQGTVNCSRDTEGTSGALYGGASPTDNSGRMSYVQIRYSGFVLGAGKELQSLTPSGVGSGTQIDHFQSFNSSDDGIEVFGGRPTMKYLVITGADDDSLDTDVGYKGFMQYVLAIQRPGGQSGDAMIENDSNGNEDAVPRTNVKLANFTFIHRGNVGEDQTAILLRGGGDYALYNGIVVSQSTQPCLRINSATTLNAANTATDEAGPPVFQSVLFSGCATPFGPGLASTNTVTPAQVASTFNAGSNNNSAFTSTLTSLFINGTAETAATAIDPTTISSQFSAGSYVGAVRNSSDTWYRNWTCNSSYADFGSSTGLCTSLPTN
jgi:hypothetical protein